MLAMARIRALDSLITYCTPDLPRPSGQVIV